MTNEPKLAPELPAKNTDGHPEVGAEAKPTAAPVTAVPAQAAPIDSKKS